MKIKERPILFSAPMVRAILDGQKTQTRRVITGKYADPVSGLDKSFAKINCRYGQPGDQLWVRESWRTSLCADDRPPRETKDHGLPFWYEADDQCKWTGATSGGPSFITPGKLRPPIHMPRWGSRITLEITGIRIQRLQDMSEEDARAEGITDGGCLNCGNSEPCGCSNPQPDARDSFIWLWGSINGKAPGKSWIDSPWVWVVEFRRK